MFKTPAGRNGDRRAMALLRTEISIAAAPDAVWEVIRDFATGPQRMAPGFVVGCRADVDVRIVTFADGTVVHERFLGLDDGERRIRYGVVGGSVHPDHDTAEMRVVPEGGGCRLVWTHDVRPDALGPAFQASMDRGAEVIRSTLAADDPVPGGHLCALSYYLWARRKASTASGT
jgi:Polyketide cyclase / dehydrase and lipid transport